MTGSDSSRDDYSAGRRRSRRNSPNFDRENIREELTRILQRAQAVASTPRDDFVDGAPSYDVASMVIIRLASLTERAEFGPWLDELTPMEVTAIRATRNIAAHAGYTAMNNEVFWNAVTVRVPEIIGRLLKR
ncbi:antitoxin [Brevibacterium celere]|uniref:antitoxin n=1 Tax=Brevibacterium celere TaxID=225845 RepID=UPI0031DD1978